MSDIIKRKNYWKKLRIALNMYGIECAGQLPPNIKSALMLEALQLDLLCWDSSSDGFIVNIPNVFPEYSEVKNA